MATLLDLPDEIFEEVLIQPCLEASDISNLSQSSLRCWKVVSSDAKVWKRLMSTHFPNIADQIEETPNCEPNVFWRQTFIAR